MAVRKEIKIEVVADVELPTELKFSSPRARRA